MTRLDLLVGVALGTAVLLYFRGWRNQPQAGPRTLLPQPWRIVTFVMASLMLAGVLYSPLHSQAIRYFSAHVLQRLLLVSLIPVIFLSGNPMPILHAGLPRQAQARLQQLPQKAPKLHSFLIMILHPLPVWFIFAATFWLWHDVQLDRLVL